jgi:hypothetical protein
MRAQRVWPCLAIGGLLAGCFDDLSSLSGGAGEVDRGTLTDAQGSRDGGAGDWGHDAGSADAADGQTAQGCVSTEICNGLDDTCDGKIDEGCPVGLVEEFNRDHPLLGLSDGGVPFNETCPPGEALVGLRVAFGSLLLMQVRGVCAKYALVTDKTKTPYQYYVGFAPPLEDLPPHPDTSTTFPDSVVCPTDFVLAELWISEGTMEGYSPFIPSIKLVCQRLILTESDGPTWKFQRTDDQIVGPRGALVAPSLKDYVDRNFIPVHLLGAVGNYVDRVGLGDSKLSVKVF